jgi:glycosyltransferase involved in cell wall biosynthesis
MRILFTITSLGVGGAERLLVSLADCYVALGHEVTLVYFHGEAELRPSDPKVKICNLEMHRSPLSVIKAMWRLRQLIREHKPDVVNSHLVHANILTRLLRVVNPMPRLVSSAHNTNEEGRMRFLAYRLTDRLADMSTNVSDEAVKAFEQQGALRPGRMVTIQNGIDTAALTFVSDARARVLTELSLNEATPLLLAVGRLWEQKDYPNLLRAFSHLAISPELPHLVIVGDGPLRGELVEMAESLGISDRLHFLGLRHDVADLLSACDFYVMSSAWEGLPMVILEAMACQCFVVATDCGGIRSVLGETGFVVPTQNSEALASALERSLQLPNDERKNMGRAARERVVKHFSLKTTAERYLSVYRGDGPIDQKHEQGAE